ncbi:hepatic sodium/bile acid cotransporter-like [Watersipora subatra]|uniref:hepatic sodium/bile acid cotransporter-like n=1 Tax=Watersipora subatra TaxID=2589382 RepID=UPI00355C5E4D
MSRCWICISLLITFSVYQITADTLPVLEGNATDTFRLISPEEKSLTTYYGNEPTLNTVLLITDMSFHNLSVLIESSNTGVAKIFGEVMISPCQETNSFNFTNDQNYSSTSEYSFEKVQSSQTCYNLSFHTEAVYIGYSTLKFYASVNESSEVLYVQSVLLRSIRPYRPLDSAYNISIMVLVAVVMLATGNNLEFETIKEHLKKPKAPIIALISQFTIMPLIAYGIIWLMGYTGGKALGFFTLGCSPGGGTSNMYSKLFNGDLSLSVTMTTLSTIACLGMLPLWLYTLGATIPADEGVDNVELPFMNILQSLALIVFPLAIGALMKYKLPRVALLIKKCLKVLFILTLITFLTLGIYVKFYIFYEFDAELILAASSLPFGGFVLGGLLAWICRFDWPLIKTISIETGLQSAAVCILVVMSVSGQPDMDLALILPTASTIVAGWPFYILLPIYMLRQRIIKKRKAKLEKRALDSESFIGEKKSKTPIEDLGSTESESSSRGNAAVELKLLNQ